MSGKPTVLIVEDEPLQRMLVGDFVEEAGYAPVFARDAPEAITLLEGRGDIRVLLTDIDMPGGMDGLQLAHIVTDRWPSIRVMVLSGKGIARDARLPERSRFFGKPYAPEQMVSGLRALMLG